MKIRSLIIITTITYFSCASPPRPKSTFDEGIERSDEMRHDPVDIITAGDETVITEGTEEKADKERKSDVEDISADSDYSTAMIDGYRIQVLASSSSESSEKQANQIRTLTAEPVYIEEDQGLWKIQIGDFIDRSNADKIKTFFIEHGYQDSWVVSRKVKNLQNHLDSNSEDPSMIQGPHFRIQVYASSSREKAESYANSMRELFVEPIFVEEESELWKVQIGRFTLKNEAYQFVERVKSQGLENAWVVKKQ